MFSGDHVDHRNYAEVHLTNLPPHLLEMTLRAGNGRDDVKYQTHAAQV